VAILARELHKRVRAAFDPSFAEHGFARIKGATVAAWARPSGEGFVVAATQASQGQRDPYGWFGTAFTFEFRTSAKAEPLLGRSPGSAMPPVRRRRP